VTIGRRVFNAGLESPLVPISSDAILQMIGTGSSSHAGVKVTEEKISGLSAVWRAVNLIAGSLAGLPLHVYKTDDAGVRRLVTSGNAANLVASPHKDMTPFEFWETVVAHMLLWGNAYLQKELDPLGRLVGFTIVHPSRVKVHRLKKTGTKVFVLDQGEVFVTEDTILHLPALGYDGICGASPVRLAREGFALALAAEEYGSRLFGSGLLSTGVLQTEQRLTEDQANALSKRWEEKQSGLEKAHKTIVLDSGASFTKLSMPPDDAQFLESRSFQISEIARWFGTPPHMLMHTEKSTSWGSGIEQQSLGFVVFTLRSWLIRIEQRITPLLYPQPTYAKFSVEGLLRGDSAQRGAFYKTMWEMGALSTNDILALEDRPPVEGGDARYRPLNMGELGTFDGAAAAAEPVEEPPAQEEPGTTTDPEKDPADPNEPAEPAEPAA